MAATDWISWRRLGDVEVAVVAAAKIHGWTPQFEPGQDWTEAVDLAPDGSSVGGQNWLAVRTPGAVVLVDPSDVEPGEKNARASFAPTLPLDDALAALGIDPKQVTHVVITHFHGDHLSGLLTHAGEPRFPNAVHVAPARDWETFVDDDVRGTAPDILRRLGTTRERGLLRLVDGDAEVVPGVTAIDAPGESPGHLCVRIESGAGSVWYLGDLIHFPVETRHIDWVAVADRPVDELVASRLRVFSAAAPDALHVFTHGVFPCWGRLESLGAGSWEWRYLDA